MEYCERHAAAHVGPWSTHGGLYHRLHDAIIKVQSLKLKLQWKSIDLENASQINKFVPGIVESIFF